jgi:hypothetical protein
MGAANRYRHQRLPLAANPIQVDAVGVLCCKEISAARQDHTNLLSTNKKSENDGLSVRRASQFDSATRCLLEVLFGTRKMHSTLGQAVSFPPDFDSTSGHVGVMVHTVEMGTSPDNQHQH